MRISFKLLLTACLIVVFLASCGAENVPITNDDGMSNDSTQVTDSTKENKPLQQLGVNLNGRLWDNYTQIRQTGTTWVRSFLPFFSYTDSTNLAKIGGMFPEFRATRQLKERALKRLCL